MAFCLAQALLTPEGALEELIDRHRARQRLQGPVDDAMRVMTPRWCQSGQIGVQVRAALRAGVVRVRDQEGDRTPASRAQGRAVYTARVCGDTPYGHMAGRALRCG
jgi:hypothetical protein